VNQIRDLDAAVEGLVSGGPVEDKREFMNSLYAHARKIAGAGGTFGLQSISEIARRLDGLSRDFLR